MPFQVPAVSWGLIQSGFSGLQSLPCLISSCQCPAVGWPREGLPASPMGTQEPVLWSPALRQSGKRQCSSLTVVKIPLQVCNIRLVRCGRVWPHQREGLVGTAGSLQSSVLSPGSRLDLRLV